MSIVTILQTARIGGSDTLRPTPRPEGSAEAASDDFAPTSIDALLARARQRISVVTPSTTAAMRTRGALLVDTRPVGQRVRFGHVPDALVIDRNVLEWRLDPTSPHRHVRVMDHHGATIVFCQEGYSSSLAVATLVDLGMRDVHDLAGGFEAWAAAGLPVEPASQIADPLARDSWPPTTDGGLQWT